MKALGYTISIVGLACLASTLIPSVRDQITKLVPIDPKIILLIGTVLVVIGVLLLPKGSNQPSEVPIYEGQGKNRKIVGYQRMKK